MWAPDQELLKQGQTKFNMWVVVNYGLKLCQYRPIPENLDLVSNKPKEGLLLRNVDLCKLSQDLNDLNKRAGNVSYMIQPIFENLIDNLI